MTRLARLCRAVGVGLAVVTATLSMTQMAHAQPSPPPAPAPPGAPAVLTPPDVPEAIKPPPGNQPFLLGRATGVQTYTCNDRSWSKTSVPTADLVGDNNSKLVIVKHFAGPTWQATDGSTAIKDPDPAVLVKSVISPTGAIPWLLLTTKAAAGPNGDRLAGTTFIQRVNTTDGVTPPAEECTATTPANTKKDVPYTADYYFWKATGGA